MNPLFKHALFTTLAFLLAAAPRVAAETPLVRTLLAGEAQAAGKHELDWDRLDRLGKPMPAISGRMCRYSDVELFQTK